MSISLTFTDSEISILLAGIAAIRQANPMTEILNERLNPLERKLIRAENNFSSIWSVDDAYDIIVEDEVTDDMSGETVKAIAKCFFDYAVQGDRLADIIGQCGNDYLEMLWSIKKNEILSEILTSE